MKTFPQTLMYVAQAKYSTLQKFSVVIQLNLVSTGGLDTTPYFGTLSL